MKHRLFIFLVLIVAAFTFTFIGCGGGGGTEPSNGGDGGGDTTAPSVKTLLPADGAIDSSLNSNFVITFDEAVSAGTGNLSIYDSGDVLFEAIDVASAQVTSAGSDSFVIDPTPLFIASESYYVQADAGAFKDASNNSFAGIGDKTTWDFQAGVAEDTAAPIITDLFPADEAIDVPLNVSLVINFDEAVIPGTGYVRIYDSDAGDLLFEEIDVSSDQVTGFGTDTITVDPSRDFAITTNYYVRIEPAGAIKDISNQDFAGIVDPDTTTWNFQSGTAPDSTPPSISVLSPLDDETDVLPTANLVITFDEAVFTDEGNITIYDSGDTLFEAIDVTSAQVTGSGTDTVTIDPTTDFTELTNYYVMIDPGAFRDGANYDFPGITSSTSWNFGVRDNTPPAISKVYPVDGATAVPTNANLIIVFSEAVNVGSGFIKVYDSLDVVDTIDVTSGQVTGSGTDTIFINRSVNLTASDPHYILIDDTAFVDASAWANPFVGIGETTTWELTAGTSADLAAPLISSRIPSVGAINVPLNTNLQITFDEVVFVDTGDIEIYESGYGLRESIDVTSSQVTGSWTNTITIDSADFPTPMMFYWIMADETAFYDISGNYFTGITDASWNFMTGDSTDTIPPSISTQSPDVDATDVSLVSNLEITFDEAVNAGSGNISIYDSGDTLIEQIDVGSAQVTGLGTANITVAPSSDFDGLTGYYVLIDTTAFKDSANNYFEGISDPATWSFTTEIGDLLGGYESFDYGVTGGDLDTYSSGSWTEMITTPTTKVQYVATGGYSYANYSEFGADGKATGQNDATGGVMKRDLIAAATKNAVYLGFIVDGITTVNGSNGFGVGFYDTIGGTRLGGVYFVGGPQTGGARYSAYLDDGITSTQIMSNKKGSYLVVIKYDFSNDTLSGYIDPDFTLAEPTQDGTISVSSPWTNIDAIVLDESWKGIATSDCTYGVDEIKVTKSWGLLAE